MHDWILKEIRFEWQSASVMIELEDSTFAVRTLKAEGVQELLVPHANEWGPSVNVNELLPVETLASGLQQLRIEMQSGDVIRIVAERFQAPQ